MAKIAKIENGVVVSTNTATYNFPLNSIILDADDRSGSINFKLKSYRRTIFTVHYKEFVDIQSNNAQDTVKIIQNNIIYS